jgi:drug/metabolite transporter (DMT)-like permease
MNDLASTLSSSHHRDHARERLIGIGLVCLAFFCFCCLDTTAKWLNLSIPTAETVWARYLSSTIIVAIVMNPRTTPGVYRSKRPWVQLIRSVFLLVSTLMNFIAVNYLQLSQTMTIALATPFVVALLAGPTLGEKVSRERYLAIVVGFCGVILVARPGFGGIHPAAILSVIGVFCYAAYALLTRLLASHDSTETTLFYSNIAGAVVLTAALPLYWQTPSSWFVSAMMMAAGLFAAVGHFFMIKAHRYAPANVLSPFMYTELVWMVISGFLVFGDVPDGFTILGAAVVTGSGLFLIYAERRKSQAMLAAE